MAYLFVVWKESSKYVITQCADLVNGLNVTTSLPEETAV